MNNKLRPVWVYLLGWLLYMFSEGTVYHSIFNVPYHLQSSVILLLHGVCKLCIFTFLIKYIITNQTTLSLKEWFLKRAILSLGIIVAWNWLVQCFLLPHFLDSFLWSSQQNFWFQVSTYTFTISWAISYGFAQLLLEKQKQQQFDQQENQRLNDAINQAELASLKKQISPHFFYNTLNFFYAQSVQYSENLSRGIMLLSEIMRYAIKDDDEEGKVHLGKEVAQIKNYVELNQLRFDNQLCVQFDINGNLEYRRIVPLILLTFVENAFKFGDLMDPNHPLSIEISVKENHLTFKTYNKKCSEAKKQSGGIGLSNTRRRLLLAYPNRHKLTTSDEGDFFSVTLHLVL